MFKRKTIGAGALTALLALSPCSPILAASFAAGGGSLAPFAAQDDEPSAAEGAMFTRGQNFYLQGRYDQAVGVLNEFLKTYPQSTITDLTLLWLGRSYMQLGRLQEADQVGQRLRAIRDTPFVDIYDSELLAARTERRNAPGSDNAQRNASTTPPVEVAAARPTPTPARPTPTLVRPTPTPVAIAASPEAGRPRRSGRQSRRGIVPSTTTNTATAGITNGAASNTNSAAPANTATTRRPAGLNINRGTGANRASQQVAVNRPGVAAPSRTPAVAAVVMPTPATPSIDPARSVDTTTTTNTYEAPSASTGQVGGTSINITVKHVPNLTLALRRPSFAASPGQPVQLPLVVTNTGNKEDTFRVESDLPAEFQPTFSPAQGGSDSGVPIMVTPQLARGASYELLLNLRVPDTAPDNQQRPFIVRAASLSDSLISKVTDAELTVVAAALSASANASGDTVMPGETLTQTIAVRNQGSAPSRNTRVDFVFNPEFELVSANPSPLVYDRASRTAIWSLGELDSRNDRQISVTVRAVPEALATRRALGRGAVRTASLITPSNFDGPAVQIGRVVRARIDSVSAGLTTTPGDTVFVPFIVRNPGNYAESFDLRVTAPGAPAATVYADINGDGRHQDGEPAVTQTTAVDPRGGQYPLLLRIDIPRSTPDRQQYAYNLVVRASQTASVASEASTVLTVAAPRVRVRSERGAGEVAPGDTFFYRLVLVNDGAGLARNVVVTETLPQALEFVSSDPSLSAQDISGGSGQRLVWRVADLSPGDTSVLLVTVRLRPGVSAETTISPTHTLSYQDSNNNSYTGQ